jgi:hypothetical protein
MCKISLILCGTTKNDYQSRVKECSTSQKINDTMQGSYQDNCKTSYLLFKPSYKSIIKLKQIVIKFIFKVQDVMIEGAEVIQ